MTIHHWIIRSLGRIVLIVGIGIIGFGISGGMVSHALAQAEPEASEESQVDPWEPFNEKMFWFNRRVDLYLLKPIATGYDTVLPDPVQKGVRNVIDNVDVLRRLVNNIFQLKFGGAGRELARFTINSTIGIVGLFDVAGNLVEIKASDEDTGQTMGVYGVGPGPYLVLPLMPVTTVRDGFGFLVDTALNPLNYVFPIVVGVNGVTAGIAVTDAINERSLNLDEFQRVEETVIDLYGAVRSAYLQRRAAAIKE